MKKIYCMFFLVFIANLAGQDVLAILKSVQNNHMLHMRHLQQPFVCKPYGVETLSELEMRTDTNSSCRQSIDLFRQENPQEKYFAVSILKIEQQYSVESIQGLCMLHLSSAHSYSEALLEEGYALVSSAMIKDDEVLEQRFKKALLRAKKTKAGIWSDTDVRNCFRQ